MKEMKIVARHMVGDYKYIILHNLKGEESPVRVHLAEAKIIVKPAYDEEEGHCLSVSTKYEVYDHCRGIHYVDEKDIYDTKEGANKVIEFRRNMSSSIDTYKTE